MGPYQCKGLERPKIFSKAVLEAMSRVPRHELLPDEVKTSAYEDCALPIGYGQTVSQPYIVALMTQTAQIRPGHKVLEIGTGSGYQAAVLCELGAFVFSIEIIAELAAQSQDKLHKLGYTNVIVRRGDGFDGWPEEAPFDSILVAAASPSVPPALLQQLKDGGRLIIPLENKWRRRDSQMRDGGEILTLIKREGIEFKNEDLDNVRFVPLTGEVRKGKMD